MTMPLLAELRAAGFRLVAAGEWLRVSPASKLTDELRAAIRQQKPQLLAALLASAAAPAAPVDLRLLTADATTQAQLLALAERAGWPAIRHWTGTVLEGEARWRAWVPRLNALSVGYFTGALERRRQGCPDGVGLDEWLGRDHDAEQAKESETSS